MINILIVCSGLRSLYDPWSQSFLISLWAWWSSLSLALSWTSGRAPLAQLRRNSKIWERSNWYFVTNLKGVWVPSWVNDTLEWKISLCQFVKIIQTFFEANWEVKSDSETLEDHFLTENISNIIPTFPGLSSVRTAGDFSSGRYFISAVNPLYTNGDFTRPELQ